MKHFPDPLLKRFRPVSKHYFGDNGLFAVICFEFINENYFDNLLPRPLITCLPNTYGRLHSCEALLDVFEEEVIMIEGNIIETAKPIKGKLTKAIVPKKPQKSKAKAKEEILKTISRRCVHPQLPPCINIHPILFGNVERDILKLKNDKWAVKNRRLFGYAYVFDVIVHECLHIAVHYLHNGYDIPNKIITSHNNPVWVNEINRISTLMGFDTRASLAKMKRIDIKGKKVPRRTTEEGCMSYKDMGLYPHSLRPDKFYINKAKNTLPKELVRHCKGII